MRLAKPTAGPPPKHLSYDDKTSINISNMKPFSSNSAKANLFDSNLNVGNIVMHERFGKGEILNIEGVGGDKKAEIRFDIGGIKKLLLRFAKLQVLG